MIDKYILRLLNSNSERPVDALAEKHILLTHSVTDNLKSRDASASKKEWMCGRGGGGQSQPNILSFWLQMLIVLFCSSGFSFLISPLSFFSFISGSIEPIQPPTHPPGTKLKQWNFSTTIIIFIIHVPSSVLDNAPRDRQRKLTKNLGNLNFCWVSLCLEA